MRTLVVLASLLAVLATAPAHAARPSTGVFAPPEALELAWEGEAAGYGVSLFPEVSRLNCRQPFCDGYVFSVPKGLPAGSTVELVLTARDATGFTDVFVTDPPGTKTYYEGAGGQPATEVLLEQLVPGDYLVQVYTNAPAFLRAGAYTGAARLVLPEPPPA